jgi:UDP-N-acetylglucosamine transferase subunit ALG13
MIFVSVGTHEAPFDRMLRAVYGLNLDEQLVVQYGPSGVRCDGAVEAEYLPFDEVVAYIREARAVVTHPGVGSVMISLANGKRPIVMARLREHREHVDDHQLELARRMEASGLVTLAEDVDSLAEALSVVGPAPGHLDGAPWLGTDLSEFLAEHLGGPTTAQPRAA